MHTCTVEVMYVEYLGKPEFQHLLKYKHPLLYCYSVQTDGFKLCCTTLVIQQVKFFFFTKLPSVKGLDDMTLKWDISKLTHSNSLFWRIRTFLKNILLDFQCL